MRGLFAVLAFLGSLTVSWPAQALEPPAVFCSVPTKDPRQEEVPLVHLDISHHGEVSWNNVRIDTHQLDEFLADAKTENPYPEFHLTIATDTPFGSLQPVVWKVQDADTYWITLSIPERERGVILCQMKELQHRQLPAKLHIWLHANGQLLWNGSPITMLQFDQWSRAAANENPRLVVNIHPARNVTYSEIIGLMTKFISVGLRDFAIGRYGHIVNELDTRPN